MIRFVANFLFVLIIFVLATALPLSMDIFSFDLSPVIVNEPSGEDKTFQVAQYTVEVIKETPSTLVFNVKTTQGVLDDYWKNNLILEAIANNGHEALRFDTLPVVANEQVPNQFKLDLTSLLKDAASDNYAFTLSVNETISNITLNGATAFNYTYVHPNLTYKQNIPELVKPMSRVVLYYPSEDLKQLIPVTLDLNIDANFWRLLYDYHSTKVPTGLGLKSPSPIITSPNIQLKNKVAYIYHYAADIEGRESDIAISQQAVAKTFLKNGTYNAVQFLFGNQMPKDLGGVDWSKPYNRKATANAYFGFETEGNRLLLEPLALEELSLTTTTDNIKKIWDVLTFKNTAYSYNPNWLPLIPSDLILKAVAIENGILSLDFSEEFNQYATEKPELFSAFIDSVLFTYRSLPEITAVKFTVNGQAPVLSEWAEPISKLPVLNYVAKP